MAMTPHVPTTTRRARGGRGAALVEFALILPILAMLIFGIIDFGKLFNDWQQLRQGVRQAAREGAVTNFASPPPCTLTGFTGSAEMQALACKVKGKAGLGDGIRVGFWLPDSGVTPKAWSSGGTLRVCAMAPAESLTGITRPFLNGKVYTARVDIRIEQDLATNQSFGEAHETAIGSGWPSSCGT
jgi:hypothetical protein